MATGKPIEERFRVIEHVVLATRNSNHSHEDGFKQDFCLLIQAIVLDETVACTCKQRLYGTLRKTAAWEMVRPFLVYGDNGCSGPGCGHAKSQHRENGKCSGTSYQWNQAPYHRPCECKGPFVAKDFK